MPEVLKILFENDIQENLFPKNEFYTHSRKDGGIEPDVTKVEVPNAGEKPAVVKNPAVYPLTINQRLDDKKEYPVDLYATLPIHIPDDNELVTSYDKRQDVLKDHVSALNTSFADDIAFAWSPAVADLIKRTTGANGGALAPGAAGLRRLITRDDIIEIFTAMNEKDVPEKNRKALFPAQFYKDLLKIDDFIHVDKIGTGKLSNGAIGMILGFEVFLRSRTTIYTNDPVKKSPGALGDADDNFSALFWHPDFVRHAEGNVKVYLNEDRAEWLGGIMNTKVRAGGAIGRNDEVGVVALVQDHGA